MNLNIPNYLTIQEVPESSLGKLDMYSSNIFVFEILESWNLEMSKSWNLGMLEFGNLETLKLWNFETLKLWIIPEYLIPIIYNRIIH